MEVKQGCKLAPTLFVVFFSLLLPYAFSESEYGVHSTFTLGLFNLARLRVKPKRGRSLFKRFSSLAMAATLRKHCSYSSTVLSRLDHQPQEDEQKDPRCEQHLGITIDIVILEVIDDFTYLGCFVSTNLSLDAEIKKRICKAAMAVARLAKKTWDNVMLTIKIKKQVYRDCVLSESFSLLPPRAQIQHLSAQPEKDPGHHVASPCLQPQCPTGQTSQAFLRCAPSGASVGSATSDEWRIPKDVLYGENAIGSRPVIR